MLGGAVVIQVGWSGRAPLIRRHLKLSPEESPGPGASASQAWRRVYAVRGRDRSPGWLDSGREGNRSTAGPVDQGEELHLFFE